MANSEVQDNVILELRRGVVLLAVLSQLEEEQYGYSLLKRLADQGLDVDQGTLYPLLRRLEGQGLLGSDWRIEEGRPRRYYRISAAGREALPALRGEWDKIVGILSRIFEASARKTT